MVGETIALSGREWDRAAVIKAVVDRRLRQGAAARQLKVSIRQVKRLVRRYRAEGAAGLRSRRRGRPSNRRLDEAVRVQAMELIRTHYPDFGPTFAREQLIERHGLSMSVETLRQWMIGDGLWQPKRRREQRAHPRRERRACVGELVQVDGSEHAWFEDRGPRCTLLVFIDDASGALMYLRFVPSETTWSYFAALRAYLGAYGRPVSLYSDKHSVFRINALEACRGTGLTQFGRVLATLEIEAIHAHSPQAKGRVERVNGTLQDRLVKELRLAGIDDPEAGNAFLETYRTRFNAQFAIAPRSERDAHRPLRHTAEELDLIFSRQSQRTVSKNLEVQYDNRVYQLDVRKPAYGLRQAKVTVCEQQDGTVSLLHRGRPLMTHVTARARPPRVITDSTTVNTRVSQALKQPPRRKPAADHPWRHSIINPPNTPSLWSR